MSRTRKHQMNNYDIIKKFMKDKYNISELDFEIIWCVYKKQNKYEICILYERLKKSRTPIDFLRKFPNAFNEFIEEQIIMCNKIDN